MSDLRAHAPAADPSAPESAEAGNDVTRVDAEELAGVDLDSEGLDEVTPDELIARFLAQHGDFPEDVIESAKRSIVDTVACMIAGLGSDLAGPLLGYLSSSGAQGDAPILGTNRSTSPDRAAFVNGTLGHALDFDDTVSVMPGHPGSVLLSALLACPEIDRATGRQLMDAFVCGFEVATKTGIALGAKHYRQGWHTNSTAGIFGATAAVARLLGADAIQARHALGITASMSAGIRANFGTMTKPMHSGWAASSGMTAARLAMHGFTAADRAYGSFLRQYGGDGAKPAALQRLGAPFTMERPGVALKKYPCCYAVHRVIDALTDLRREGLFADRDVDTVAVRVAPHVLDPLPYRRPRTGFEAKFSMEYVLAAGVLDGHFGFEAFTDDAVNRDEIRRLLERVKAVEDPAMSPEDPEGAFASSGTRGEIELTVRFTDGETVTRRVRFAPGAPQRPLTWSELQEKFLDCAAFGGLTDDRARAALGLLDGLADLDKVLPLLTALTGE